MTVKKCNCPHIDTADWEGKEFEWENQTFYFVPINLFFHKPMGLHEKVRQLRKEVVSRNYEFTDFTPILTSWAAFKGRVMAQIQNPQQYDEGIYIFDSGTIYSTVFQGSAKEFKQAVSDFSSKVELDHGIPPQAVLVWYVHCEQCAKERNNQAVIFIKT